MLLAIPCLLKIEWVGWVLGTRSSVLKLQQSWVTCPSSPGTGGGGPGRQDFSASPGKALGKLEQVGHPV